jgi:hypothetical protein
MSPFEMTPILTSSPLGPLFPKNSLFTQQKYLILEWQQKNSAKTLHTTTTTYFFWQIQNKKLKNFCRI